MNSIRSRGWLVLTFILAGAAYAIAAFCLVVLTWDGAGYVFNSIQRGHPAIPNGRYSDYPFLGVVSVCSQVISDARWLACIYGLALAVLPLGSLWLSFYFLSSPRWRALRIWPVLGILLSVLPGQIFLVAEAVPVTQVAWAVWAILAGDISAAGLVWLGALTIFVFFLHPTAALVYAAAGGLLLGKAWQRAGASENERERARTTESGRERARTKDPRPNDLARVPARFRSFSLVDQWLGLAFLGLAAIRLCYALATANSYEQGEETFAQNYLAFREALPSLRMLPCVYFLGLVVLGGVTGVIPRRFLVWPAGLTLGWLLIYGAGWATDPHVWMSAFSFRRFVLVGTLPLLAMGAFHWWYEKVASTHNPEGPASDSGIGFVGLSSAAVFLFVFATQSFSWRQELTRFQADLSHCNKPVATTDDLPWIARSPLHHWASTQLSCVVQGKKVKTLFALHAEDVQGNQILLFPGIWFRKSNHWFEFE